MIAGSAAFEEAHWYGQPCRRIQTAAADPLRCPLCWPPFRWRQATWQHLCWTLQMQAWGDSTRLLGCLQMQARRVACHQC